MIGSKRMDRREQYRWKGDGFGGNSWEIWFVGEKACMVVVALNDSGSFASLRMTVWMSDGKCRSFDCGFAFAQDDRFWGWEGTQIPPLRCGMTNKGQVLHPFTALSRMDGYGAD
jgi:hypothetical protein